jgi:hypothetical protein
MSKMHDFKVGLFLLLFLVISMLPASHSEAYVDLIRDGYTNCTTCHISPSGGGILTDYGRKLSHEVLSTWGTEREVGPLNGLIPPHNDDAQIEKWLGVGGDLRAVQFLNESNLAKEERSVWMQGLIEGAVRMRALTADMTIGRFDTKNTWTADSMRFYLLYQFNDNHSLRVGRFLPAFGLNIPEHISPTRGALGLGFNSERDAAEWTFLNENWNLAVGASKNPQDPEKSETIENEEAVNAQVQRNLSETIKIGGSLWMGRGEKLKRQMLALHCAIGINKYTYLLAEIDSQFLQPDDQDSRFGYFGHYRLGYDLFKGFQAFAWIDHSQSNDKKSNTYSRHWGPGFAFFPRPHFEISGAWLRELNRAISNKEGDYAWLQLHYYL